MSAGRVAIFGGRGCLGAYFVEQLKIQEWWVASIDRYKNRDAHQNILVPNFGNWMEQERQVMKEMGDLLKSDHLDAVLCFAGGHLDYSKGGNATNCLSKQTDMMWTECVMSSAIAASLSTKYLAPQGLLVLTGARSALHGTPSMIGYGMAKAAVHHLAKSLGSKRSGLPKDSSVVAILPDCLDTPLNREMMPHGCTETWTPLSFVFSLVSKWIQGEDRPPSGSLLAIITADNVTRVKRLQEEVDSNIIM